MITVFAPDGAGEVAAGTDLADLVLRTVAADEHGPLLDGDVVVLTSKVLSKAAGLTRPGSDREAAVDEQTVRTVARRGPTRIVRTRHGLTLAAAGVDASNVAAGTVLVLPADPDAEAAALLAALTARTGLALAVVVSDTAGRAWREGQTDQAIGAAGLRVLLRYAGRQDDYGNDLKVTAMAVADEVAGAADLVKGKLAGRPVAVVRGLGHLVEPAGGPDGTARALVRDPELDMFSHGAREAVLLAALTATGQAARYEQVLALNEPDRTAAVLAGTAPDGEPLGAQAVALVRALLAADLR
ncbi:coenzyme F420-0:L-glutamate ligase / coenzyme F420-1:gamma-L-glutamate ligase [Friedmanniella luteola]|uniref:Coenzyme F420-0:L-glutamate ligase / coenzyme F420-1:gamma-L-glutamate ligase n=1 Tax=Friedmanniella luteola TaxID=546871 RepID=A0A1H1YHJ8_9ACTN|nr:coenzyme F420-0:L-glutamate ligase [Friedmanniella luteola]SDT20496.1 coenzyme F420-0:L-glutamate ligase / coenzyme F420-1:gamma-L-glutamate ligase [Friedmanniella luteola]